MTPDDATAGPSTAPLTPSAQPKPPSPTKPAGPRDKENTPDAELDSMHSATGSTQRLAGHSRTPSGHDAMTRDMGNLQLNPGSRQASQQFLRLLPNAITKVPVSPRSLF